MLRKKEPFIDLLGGEKEKCPTKKRERGEKVSYMASNGAESGAGVQRMWLEESRRHNNLLATAALVTHSSPSALSVYMSSPHSRLFSGGCEAAGVVRGWLHCHLFS